MYLYFEATAALYTVTVLTVLVVIAGIICSIVLWSKGKAKSLHHGIKPGVVARSFVFDVLLQLQILKISFIRWLMHICIFIGFMGLLAQTTVMAIMSHLLPEDSLLPQTFFAFNGQPVGGAGSRVLDVWGDFFGLMLFAGLCIAIVRRYIVRTRQLDTVLKDTLSLTLLMAITVTGFLSEAFRLMDPMYASVAWYSFAGYSLTNILQAVGIGAMDYKTWVWIHAIISFVFLALIPFSKAWHIFVSPLELVLDASERA
jgi:heterodisulfide reductase subunit E